MAMDAWFFFLFSGVDVTKFKRLAKDVYGTYFFFCLVGRLPTIHMFVSVLALGLFLLSTAWIHSPTIALVICCVFGVFVGSQMLAYVLRVRCKRCNRTTRPRPRRTLSALRIGRVAQTVPHRPAVSSGSPRRAWELDVFGQQHA
ncbi:hypothetical protein LXA43DRAFT_370990 [Ganoderma leucocontextum]|nr:hypothetical protein LXA43DRAFT_370990 [Ganoderma leucocontextum]